MTRYIDQHRDQFGVEPICRALQVAPSSYYAHQKPSAVAAVGSDAKLKEEITRVYKEHYSVYGAAKIWRQLTREGIVVGRDRVARLMRVTGHLRGRARQDPPHHRR